MGEQDRLDLRARSNESLYPVSWSKGPSKSRMAPQEENTGQIGFIFPVLIPPGLPLIERPQVNRIGHTFIILAAHSRATNEEGPRHASILVDRSLRAFRRLAAHCGRRPASHHR